MKIIICIYIYIYIYIYTDNENFSNSYNAMNLCRSISVFVEMASRNGYRLKKWSRWAMIKSCMQFTLHQCPWESVGPFHHPRDNRKRKNNWMNQKEDSRIDISVEWAYICPTKFRLVFVSSEFHIFSTKITKPYKFKRIVAISFNRSRIIQNDCHIIERESKWTVISR